MSRPSARPTFSDRPGDETDRLIAELRARGIAYLSGGHDAAIVADVAAHPLPTGDLLRQLANCDKPRVRNAAIALVLLHPSLVEAALREIMQSDAETAERLAVLLLAALYLLHLWRTRLQLALGREPELPEDLLEPLWQLRHLPAPTRYFGELGLRALEGAEQRRRNEPFHFLADWQDQLDHLVEQEWRLHHLRSTDPGEASDEH